MTKRIAKGVRLSAADRALLALIVDLQRQVTRLERQMNQTARQAGHAYLHTMRIGGSR